MRKQNKTQRKSNPKYSRSDSRRRGNANFTTDKESEAGKFTQGRCDDRMNDVSWYAKNDALLRDTASLSYNNPLGMPVPWETLFGNSESNVEPYEEVAAFPGLMTYMIAPVVGLGNGSTSPVNLAAQNVYSYVRYMNSGAKNYDQTDIMLYLMAMDSVYSCWNHLRRVYGLIVEYNQLNRYVPRIYVEASGLNFDSVMSNLANYREQLNVAAARISSFCVPATMSYFVRHSWLYSNVYADSSDPKAQQYMFVPRGFYKYNEFDDPNGGFLEWKEWYNPNEVVISAGNQLKTVDQAFSYLKDLIDVVAFSEDIGVMSGDILKAYGSGSLYKLDVTNPDFTVTPVYNEEVLGQIHNAVVWESTLQPVGTMDITQNPETNWLNQNLVFKPMDGVTLAAGMAANVYRSGRTVATYPGVRMDGVLLNSRKSEVTPADTMINTRLTSIMKQTSDNGYYHMTAVGSEFVWGGTIWYFEGIVRGWNPTMLSTVSHMPFSSFWNSLRAGGGDQVTYQVAQQKQNILLNMIDNFDWHPAIYTFCMYYGTYVSVDKDEGITAQVAKTSQGNPNAVYYTGCLCDISNYTTITADRLNHIHQTALLREFNIPQLSSY